MEYHRDYITEGLCRGSWDTPFQRIFNLSLGQGRVPQLWKTSCIIPVPKKPHPGELNDFRPVALTSHVMKTMERLLLHHLRPQTHHALDPLQFAYREKTGVEDAIIFLLHRSLSHLDRGSGAVRITFLDFSSAFNTIQPLLLREQTDRDGSWITPGGMDHRLPDWQTSYKSELCHVQKFTDDTAIVWAVSGVDRRTEYRELIKDFVTWCDSNHLLLNTTKTREMVVDFRRPRPHPRARKGQSQPVLPQKAGMSFNICKKLLQIFYQSVVASALLYAVVCWGGSSRGVQEGQQLAKKPGQTEVYLSVISAPVDEHKGHDTVSAAAERTERQRELEVSRQNIQQRIQDREKDVKELQQEVEAINRSADKAVEDSEKIFSQLIRLIQKRSSDVKQQLRSQQETEVSRVKELQEKLEQEITELKRKDADLKQLSHTEDHTQFLHNYPSLSALSQSTDSSSIKIRPLRYFEDVTAAVSEVRDKLQDVLTEKRTNISLTVTEVDVLLPQPEPKTRAEFFKYSRETHTGSKHSKHTAVII
ncbi:hypothetical protein L3Q82_005982 [Scortum barcoo]|uniref:Uncharacterized protein n=1 Tax=Scortum barcoo TaxID=214431 RepID=A0ACB8X2E1_9TELE|nr:hypothetical protein L3Q82_005982 [Scortum barcoo]